MIEIKESRGSRKSTITVSIVANKRYLVDKSTANSNRSGNVDAIDDDAAENGTSTAQSGDSRDGPRDAKRRKVQGGKQNKNRNFPVARDRGPKMCRQWELSGICDRPQGCKFAHNWEDYLKTKPQDVHYDPTAQLNVEPPFVTQAEVVSAGDDVVGQRLDTSTVCPVKRDLGWCPYGMKCRFLGGHLKRVEGESKGAENERYGGWELTDHIEPPQKEGWKQGETNWQDHEVIRKLRFHGVSLNVYLILRGLMIVRIQIFQRILEEDRTTQGILPRQKL
jgi:tRNA-dihydrouridine synthase 3